MWHMSLSFQADNFYSKFARMFIKDRNARNAALGPGEDRETGNCQSLHCINHMGNLAMGDAVESEVCSCMVQGVWFSSVQFSSDHARGHLAWTTLGITSFFFDHYMYILKAH